MNDFMAWYTYTYKNIHLEKDFAGLDPDSNNINKATFLNLLATGKFAAFEVMRKDSLPFYKLYAFNNVNSDIESTIKQLALREISHYAMEGRELPDYHFSDMNGSVYDRVTTKGKILVLKCWFIHCVACVKEFPELNELVDKYKSRNDILFVSLAMDKKKDLVPFLKQKQFKYAVVADEEKFMTQELKINEYPTHILIDKNGKIVKVVNSIKDLIPFLEKEAGKNLH